MTADSSAGEKMKISVTDLEGRRRGRDDAAVSLMVFAENSRFTDVTLRTNDGAIFSCHRCVLAASSSYFDRLFADGVVVGIVRIADVSSRVMTQILEFIYERECRVFTADLFDLLVAAHSLKVKGLPKLLVFHLLRLDPVDKGSVELYLRALDLCRRFHNSDRRFKRLVKGILSNLRGAVWTDALVRCRAFLDLTRDSFAELYWQSRVEALKPYEAFRWLAHWVLSVPSDDGASCARALPYPSFQRLSYARDCLRQLRLHDREELEEYARLRRLSFADATRWILTTTRESVLEQQRPLLILPYREEGSSVVQFVAHDARKGRSFLLESPSPVENVRVCGTPQLMTQDSDDDPNERGLFCLQAVSSSKVKDRDSRPSVVKHRLSFSRETRWVLAEDDDDGEDDNDDDDEETRPKEFLKDPDTKKRRVWVEGLTPDGGVCPYYGLWKEFLKDGDETQPKKFLKDGDETQPKKFLEDRFKKFFKDSDETLPKKFLKDGDTQPKKFFKDGDETQPKKFFKDGDTQPKKFLKDGDETQPTILKENHENISALKNIGALFLSHRPSCLGGEPFIKCYHSKDDANDSMELGYGEGANDGAAAAAAAESNDRIGETSKRTIVEVLTTDSKKAEMRPGALWRGPMPDLKVAGFGCYRRRSGKAGAILFGDTFGPEGSNVSKTLLGSLVEAPPLPDGVTDVPLSVVSTGDFVYVLASSPFVAPIDDERVKVVQPRLWVYKVLGDSSRGSWGSIPTPSFPDIDYASIFLDQETKKLTLVLVQRPMEELRFMPVRNATPRSGGGGGGGGDDGGDDVCPQFARESKKRAADGEIVSPQGRAAKASISSEGRIVGCFILKRKDEEFFAFQKRNRNRVVSLDDLWVFCPVGDVTADFLSLGCRLPGEVRIVRALINPRFLKRIALSRDECGRVSLRPYSSSDDANIPNGPPSYPAFRDVTPPLSPPRWTSYGDSTYRQRDDRDLRTELNVLFRLYRGDPELPRIVKQRVVEFPFSPRQIPAPAVIPDIGGVMALPWKIWQ